MIEKEERTLPEERYITYDQMNIINAFEKIWLHLSIWMRSYIKSVVYETRNLPFNAEQLLNIPYDFYGPFSLFYGTPTAQSFAAHMTDFIKAAMGVVEAIKNGDPILTNSRSIRWYETADELASFLARINVYWDENQWRYLLYQYIKLKIDEIHAIMDDNYEVEAELFNAIEDMVFLIASYMARGIIASNLQHAPEQNPPVQRILWHTGAFQIS